MLARKHMQGLTLVELLVSMALGLLVVAIATQLLVTNLMSFNAQRGIADVQDNGRFALDFMARDIRQAGLRPAGALLNPFPSIVVDGAALTADQATVDASKESTGLDSTDGASDQLVVQRLTLEDTVDCEGNAVAGGNYVVSRYFLREDKPSGSASALACDGGYHNSTAAVNLGDAGIVLMGSVENFQVLLGVGGAGVPVRYYTPDDYAALAEPRPKVLAVRLGALVSSMETTGGQIGETPDIDVLNATVTDAPSDGRIRRVFVTSIALRNEQL